MIRSFLFVSSIVLALASSVMAQDLTITVDSVQVIGTADGTGSDVKKVEVIKGADIKGSTLTPTGTPYVFNFTSTPATPLQEGVNDLTIKAEDMANNIASVPLKITVSPSSSNPYPGDLNNDKIVNVIDLKIATSALPFDSANHTAVKTNFGKQY